MQITTRCDLHLGDSRLQYTNTVYNTSAGCDLHLGDSRLQCRALNNSVGIL
jgi:hypothetical protein